MSPTLTLILYCAAIVIASLAGGWLPMIVRLTHRRMELMLSFISGVMLGVAALLLLPHAFAARLQASPLEMGAEADDVAHHVLGPLMLWLLAGFLAMFFIERFFCFHHHEAPVADGAEPAGHACEHDHHVHDHGHGHGHGRPAHAQAEPISPHALTWSGAAIGLALHSLLDGVAIAASVAAAHHGETGLIAGFGTFLVVLLHKPFDALTLGTLMAASRRAATTRHIVNLAFALLTPVGAGLFMMGIAGGGEWQPLILSAALAFAAGTFLCIALSDVLPELQFHQHDRVQLSMALVLGVIVAWGVAAMESRLHVHDDAESVAPGGEHAGHKH